MRIEQDYKNIVKRLQGLIQQTPHSHIRLEYVKAIMFAKRKIILVRGE